MYYCEIIVVVDEINCSSNIEDDGQTLYHWEVLATYVREDAAAYWLVVLSIACNV